MKTALFKPLWEPFPLPPVTEGNGTSEQTKLAVRAVVMLDPGETQISFRQEDLDQITKVTMDGVVAPYTISGNVLTFDAPNLQDGAEQTAVVVIDRAAAVDYSIFIGECVPGIRIDSSGRLRGVVGNISSTAAKEYTFGIRATWEGISADVVKMWTAYPRDNQLSWNFTTLPQATQNSAFIINGRSYYTLGEVKRGQYVEAGIDVINPDGTPLNFKIRTPADIAGEENSYAGLPVDLQMTNNPILFKGVVTADAVPGDYFAELYTDEPMAPPPIIIHFRVLSTTYSQHVPITRLHWESDSYLGVVKEALPSTLSISAVADGLVTYSIAPGSRNLPTGLTLTPTGEIRGIGPYINADETVTFTAKAVCGPLFSEKEFTFDLVNVMARRNYMTVKLPLSGPTRTAWESYSVQIPSEMQYRVGDPLFPVANPNIMLVRGLTSRAIPDLEYDEPFWTVLGPFKVAQVMGLDGLPLYDVIYRELVDPMARAGGFAKGSTVAEAPEYYPQDRTIKLADASIRNLRYDLVRKVGLNSEVAKAKTLGLKGGEILDAWMTSAQKNGTALGYVAAGVIAYLKPNMGKVLLQTLNYADLPNGHVVHFDRLNVEDGSTRYFYHLGVTNNPDVIIPGDVLPPINLRINGLAIESLRGAQPNAIINWEAQQDYVLYNFRIIGADGTVLREMEELETNTFDYTNTLWIADGRPSAVTVEITAVYEGRSSSVLRGSFALRAGWDFAWGYVYGGEPLGTSRRDGNIAGVISVLSSIVSDHVQPPNGGIVFPIEIQAALEGAAYPTGAISAAVEVLGSSTDINKGQINVPVEVVAVLSDKRSGPLVAPITVVPALVGTYARPQRTGVLAAPILVKANSAGSVTFPSGTGAMSVAIDVACSMMGTAAFGPDRLNATVVVTPALVGKHDQVGPGIIASAIEVAAAMAGTAIPPTVSGIISHPVQVGVSIKGTRIYAGAISAAIQVKPAMAGAATSVTQGPVSAPVSVISTMVGAVDTAAMIAAEIAVESAISGSTANFAGAIVSEITVTAVSAGTHIERATGTLAHQIDISLAAAGTAGDYTYDVTSDMVTADDESVTLDVE